MGGEGKLFFCTMRTCNNDRPQGAAYKYRQAITDTCLPVAICPEPKDGNGRRRHTTSLPAAIAPPPHVARLCAIVMMAVMAIGTACGKTQKKIEAYEYTLMQLDSAITHADDYRKEKEKRIGLLKQTPQPPSDNGRYMLNTQLYEEYMVYDSDSAMKYVERNIDIARRTGNALWLADSKIKKSFLLAATGLLKEALEELDGLDVDKMPDSYKVDYYGQKMYLYSHFEQFAKNNNDYALMSATCTDSLIAYIDKSHPMYLWYRGWWLRSKGSDTDLLIKELEEKTESATGDEARTRGYAMHAYLLARLYEDRHDIPNYIRCLALSGIADVKSCNKDIASVEELGYWMYEKGHMDRAFSYLNHCMEAFQQFNNRVRIIDVSTTMNNIRKYYMERNKQQEHTLHIYLAVLAMLAAVLLGAVLFILSQMKKLKLQRKELFDVNGKLKDNISELSATQAEKEEVIEELNKAVEELNEANGKLRESNYLKEEYIGYVFSLCNKYIKKLDDYRNLIYRKLTVGQVDAAKKMTASSEMIDNETKEFLHEFDVFFLNLYPNFVSDFNKLLRPEEQIVLHKDESLNTVLRIYALVRLGINDSVKIANFLNCSSQTVYNNRLKTRNKAIVPKENFAEIVRNLGKAEILN